MARNLLWQQIPRNDAHNNSKLHTKRIVFILRTTHNLEICSLEKEGCMMLQEMKKKKKTIISYQTSSCCWF